MADLAEPTAKSALRSIVQVVAAGLSLYQLIVAYPGLGAPRMEVHVPIHLMILLVVLFGDHAVIAISHRRWLSAIWDGVLIATTIATCFYLMLNADTIANRFIFADPLFLKEKILGFGILVVMLEAARRTIGWVLVWLTVVFLAYTYFGNYLPEPFYHEGFAVERIIELTYLTPEGLWNAPLNVTANFIFLFVLFGSLLLASGAGNFFTEFAYALTVRTTGGPAKTAVAASAFMGMLSGSAAANVVTTGSFTIPAMKKAGYRREFAAGVEACASSGGQLTPPIMGTAAFLMVEFVGISYTEIIKMAIIPAVLYFVAVFTSVDLEARRLKLQPGLADATPSFWAIVGKRGYLFVPVVVLLGFLYSGYTPSGAGFWAVVSLGVLSLTIDRENRRKAIRVVWAALTEAPRVMVPVSVACGIGGILAGLITLTGLGVNMSSIILDLSSGIVTIALVLTMIAAIVLGMGMPTSGAYIVLAALLAPGLYKLGLTDVASHMFIIFCVSMSTLTPPVAIASFAAAAVADSHPWRTCLEGVRLGLSVYIIPFMFVFGPSLLGFGTFLEVTTTFITATIGVVGLSISAIGWFRLPLKIYERLLAFAGAVCMISTDLTTDLAGTVLLASLFVLVAVRARRRVQADEP